MTGLRKGHRKPRMIRELRIKYFTVPCAHFDLIFDLWLTEQIKLLFMATDIIFYFVGKE